MAVRLRLQRGGAKKRPFYRVVAADKRAPRDGRFIELLGTYDPLQDPPLIRLKMDRVDYWLGTGASPSETVSMLVTTTRDGGGIDLSADGADKAALDARAAAKAKAIEDARVAAAAKADAVAKAEAEAKAAEEAAKAAEAAAAAAEASAAEDAAAAPAEDAEAASEEAAPAEEAGEEA